MRITSSARYRAAYRRSIQEASAHHQQSLLGGASCIHQKQITPLKADDTLNTERSFLQSKAFVWKQKRERRESTQQKQSTVWHSLRDMMLPGLSSQTQGASPGTHGPEGRQKWKYNFKGLQCWGPKTVRLTLPWRPYPTAPISQCIGETINTNTNNKHWRVVTMYGHCSN